MNALHMSLENGFLDDALNLISDGVDVNERDAYGSTCLINSVRYRYVEIVKALISAGTDVNAKDNYELTPLHYSIKNNYADMTKILIAGSADVNAKNSDEEAPLHYAVRHCNVDLAKILVAAGADVNANNVDEETPLHYATIAGDLDNVEYLIAAGAGVNAKDKFGDTPLHKSARDDDNVDVLKCLISAGAAVNEKNKHGKTPLDVANIYNRKQTRKVLIKNTLVFTPTTNKPKFADEKLNQFWINCEQQVKLLRETFLGNSNVSFFKFLTETDKNKLAIYSSEICFGLADLQSRNLLTQMFPVYFEDIEAQYIKGTERAHYLRESQDVMKKLFFKLLPEDIIEKIIEYLKNEELENLISTKHNKELSNTEQELK